MKADKIERFMKLAGQTVSQDFRNGSDHERKLGAQLLLSEVLEGSRRDAVMALLSDDPDSVRLKAATPYMKVQAIDYRATLAELGQASSRSLRELTRVHADQIGVAPRVAHKHSGILSVPLTSVPDLDAVRAEP